MHQSQEPGRTIDSVEVPEKMFAAKAKNIRPDIDLKQFYKCALFTKHKFSYNPTDKMIIQHF